MYLEHTVHTNARTKIKKELRKNVKIILEGKATWRRHRIILKNRFWGESDKLPETRMWPLQSSVSIFWNFSADLIWRLDIHVCYTSLSKYLNILWVLLIRPISVYTDESYQSIKSRMIQLSSDSARSLNPLTNWNAEYVRGPNRRIQILVTNSVSDRSYSILSSDRCGGFRRHRYSSHCWPIGDQIQ